MNVWCFGEYESKMESYITILETNTENNLLVGACELGGNRWSGSLWLYKSAEDAPKLGKNLTGISADVAFSDAKFLPDGKRIVTADYSGKINLVELHQPSPDCLITYSLAAEFLSHDDYPTCLGIDSDLTFVSGSVDHRNILWDIETEGMKKSMINSSAVNAVAMRPENRETFASACADGLVIAWDCRQEQPASRVVNTNFTNKSLDWTSEWVLAVGDAAGSLHLIDIRNVGQPKKEILSPEKGIRRVLANRGESLLACSVDDLSVRVFSTRNLETRFVCESRLHKDFVSGLTWLGRRLLTSGWDSQILSMDVAVTEDVPNVETSPEQAEEW